MPEFKIDNSDIHTFLATEASSSQTGFEGGKWIGEVSLFIGLGQYIQVSPTGKTGTWTQVHSHSTSNTFNDVEYFPNSSYPGSAYLIAAGDGGIIAHSADGYTWVDQTTEGNTSNALAWSNEVGLMIKAGTGIQASSDGVNWNSVSALATFTDITWATSDWNCYLAVLPNIGANPRSYKSNSGTSWTPEGGSIYLDNPRGVAFSQSLGLAVWVGDAGNVAVSTDVAATWNRVVTAPSGSIWEKVIWNDGPAEFMKIASSTASGETGYSVDGLTWITQTHVNTAGWRDVAYSDTEGVYVGFNAGAGGPNSLIRTISQSITLRPNYDSKKEDVVNQRTHRMRDGNAYRYRETTHKRYKLMLDLVTAADAAEVNGLWEAGTAVTYTHDTEVNTCYIVNKKRPFSKFSEGYEDTYDGMLELEVIV